MENSFWLLADVSNLLDDVPTDTASMGTLASPSHGTFDKLRYLPQYSVVEYIRFHIAKIGARPSAIMPTGEAFGMPACLKERDTAFTGWSRRCKH